MSLDASNRVYQSALVQTFAAGGTEDNGLATVAITAGNQAHLLVKTADSSGYTYTEGDFSHGVVMQ